MTLCFHLAPAECSLFLNRMLHNLHLGVSKVLKRYAIQYLLSGNDYSHSARPSGNQKRLRMLKKPLRNTLVSAEASLAGLVVSGLTSPAHNALQCALEYRCTVCSDILAHIRDDCALAGLHLNFSGRENSTV